LHHKNLHASVRSEIDCLQLALLCNHTSLVNGPGITTVLKPLISDLVSLQNDVMVSERAMLFLSLVIIWAVACWEVSWRILLVPTSADIAWQQRIASIHGIVTLVILRSELLKDTILPLNTLSIMMLTVKKVLSKTLSPLHDIPQFHVCRPALPPCLGYELFEGVIPADLSLCPTYFVKQKKWFPSLYINRPMDLLKLKGTEANDKPAFLNASISKVGRHAVQIWVLLRFLPVIVGDRIADTSDRVWQMLLVLREVAELVCMPRFTLEQISFTQHEMIQQYCIAWRKGQRRV
jgi:hypothetical protein